MPDCRCLWINNKGKILAKIGNAKDIAKSLGLEEDFTYTELNAIVKEITKCDAEIITTEEFSDRYENLQLSSKNIIVL